VTTAVREETVNYRGGNAALFRATEPEILLAGPSRTGKSQAACEFLNRLCLDYPGTSALIARKTRESLSESGLKTLAARILPGTARWYGDREWRYRNGSHIAAVGMNEPTRIMSTEYDIIYVQEATELEENDWELLLTRLSGTVLPRRQIIGDCNPAGEHHWLRQRAASGKLRMLTTRHEDNPTLFTVDGKITDFGDEYIAKLDNLTGVRHKRLRLGIWCSAEGMIYEEFDWNVHVCDRFAIPPEWRRFWAIDFGYTQPFVWQAWAQDPQTKTAYRFAELYHTQMLVEDVAERIKRWMTENHEDFPAAIICDHDAEDRATLKKKLGVPTIRANKSVSPGIQAVKEALVSQVREGRNGLVFMRDSALAHDPALQEAKLPTCTEEEVESYVWKEGVKDSEPVKADDHGMDAMRYLTMYLSKAGEWTPEAIRRIGQIWRGEVQAGEPATFPETAIFPATGNEPDSGNRPEDFVDATGQRGPAGESEEARARRAAIAELNARSLRQARGL